MVTLANVLYNLSHLFAGSIEIDVFITVSHLVHGGNDIKPMLQQRFAAGCITVLASAGTQRKHQCKSHG